MEKSPVKTLLFSRIKNSSLTLIQKLTGPAADLTVLMRPNPGLA